MQRHLKPGTLQQDIVRSTEHALRAGALVPVPTDYTFIEDNGVRFFVRVVTSLSRKDEARRQQEAGSASGTDVNPFLPPEDDLVVADVSDTHLAILNKFNVVEHHLLIISRHFEDQEMLLTPKDFEALWLCMAEYDGLGFYNGGREAGASQRHKHLQMVPLPLAPEGPAVPVEPLLSRATGTGITTVPGLPFLHSFVRINTDLVNSPFNAAGETFALYGAMLRSVGMAAPDPSCPLRQSLPYCLLVTRGWMLLVPRSREHFEDISLNALAFAGSLFVRTAQQLERLRSKGPLQALTSVAIPQER